MFKISFKTSDWDAVLSKFLKPGSEISDAEKDAARLAGDKDNVEEIDNINFSKSSFNVIDRK